jgi:cytochrome c peroxidase
VLVSTSLAGLCGELGADKYGETRSQAEEPMLARGENPAPIHLLRPPAAHLSAMAQLGRRIFFDAGLSGSGKLSCATCHQPDHHYGPPDAAPAMFGGTTMTQQGVRAVPSLMYLERQPAFSIGPDKEENEGVALAQMIDQSRGTAQPSKTIATAPLTAVALVPQGGLFWDGRADTLQDQALTPLLNPIEMDGGSGAAVVTKLRRSDYVHDFAMLFGEAVLDTPRQLLAEAMFAVGRYQIEETTFHPYTSKFDYWLEGKARLTPGESRGNRVFNDPAKANCAGCHTDRPGRDGTPPLFTDHQFEALGVPRNKALKANTDPDYFDLGLCGPYRTDLRVETRYCGMFMTPTLRNVATRHAYFHNGIFHKLQQVLDFYALRDLAPQKIYPLGPSGAVVKYDDHPPAYHANVDVTDPPFNRLRGAALAMTEQDESDLIAFLGTLTDGYRPGR